jgi:hypothetical protein
MTVFARNTVRDRQRTNLRDRLCTPEPECEEKSVAVERS